MKTFSQYIEHRDVNEAFFDKMKQGFKASYQSAKGDEKENASQTDKQYEKAKEVAHKAINVGKSMSDKLNKLGLSLPFAATLIAAGMTGGAAAIPIALLSKVVSDEIIHYAAKGFDKVADMTVEKKPAMAESSFVDRTGKMISGAMDKAGEAIGSGAGFIAGKTSKYYSKLRTMAEKSIGDIMLFLGHNKRYLAKALFLFAVGHVIGSGIGNATNFYAKDSLDSVASSLAGVGGVDQNELLSIMKNVGNEVSKGVDIGLHAAPHLPSNLPNLSSLKNVSREI